MPKSKEKTPAPRGRRRSRRPAASRPPRVEVPESSPEQPPGPRQRSLDAWVRRQPPVVPSVQAAPAVQRPATEASSSEEEHPLPAAPAAKRPARPAEVHAQAAPEAKRPAAEDEHSLPGPSEVHVQAAPAAKRPKAGRSSGVDEHSLPAEVHVQGIMEESFAERAEADGESEVENDMESDGDDTQDEAAVAPDTPLLCSPGLRRSLRVTVHRDLAESSWDSQSDDHAELEQEWLPMRERDGSNSGKKPYIFIYFSLSLSLRVCDMRWETQTQWGMGVCE